MRTMFPARMALWTIALLACASAGRAVAEPATQPSSANVTDAQFDEALAAAAAEKEGPKFTEPLQSVAPRFREIPITTEPGKAAWHKLTLNARGKAIDAIRFRVPVGEPRDLVWAFMPPATLTGWYILPTTGTMNGFTQFGRPSAQSVLGKAAPPGVSRVLLQSLAATNLEPGAEYIVWFRFKDEKPAPLHLAIALLPAAADLSDQEDQAVIKGLGLKRQEEPLHVVDLDVPATQPGTP